MMMLVQIQEQKQKKVKLSKILKNAKEMLHASFKEIGSYLEILGI
jgi:hypothetical protein